MANSCAECGRSRCLRVSCCRPDEDLRLQFEAVSQFDASEKKIVKALLDSLILKHQARRWASAS